MAGTEPIPHGIDKSQGRPRPRVGGVCRTSCNRNTPGTSIGMVQNCCEASPPLSLCKRLHTRMHTHTRACSCGVRGCVSVCVCIAHVRARVYGQDEGTLQEDPTPVRQSARPHPTIGCCSYECTHTHIGRHGFVCVRACTCVRAYVHAHTCVRVHARVLVCVLCSREAVNERLSCFV